MEEAVPPQHANQKVKLVVLIFCLTSIVIAILLLAFLSQNKRQSASTVRPQSRPTEKFQNPFAQEAANPFATESEYQNPFETTTNGSQEYKNPFENLR